MATRLNRQRGARRPERAHSAPPTLRRAPGGSLSAWLGQGPELDTFEDEKPEDASPLWRSRNTWALDGELEGALVLSRRTSRAVSPTLEADEEEVGSASTSDVESGDEEGGVSDGWDTPPALRARWAPVAPAEPVEASLEQTAASPRHSLGLDEFPETGSEGEWSDDERAPTPELESQFVRGLWSLSDSEEEEEEAVVRPEFLAALAALAPDRSLSLRGLNTAETTVARMVNQERRRAAHSEHALQRAEARLWQLEACAAAEVSALEARAEALAGAVDATAPARIEGWVRLILSPMSVEQARAIARLGSESTTGWRPRRAFGELMVTVARLREAQQPQASEGPFCRWHAGALEARLLGASPEQREPVARLLVALRAARAEARARCWDGSGAEDQLHVELVRGAQGHGYALRAVIDAPDSPSAAHAQPTASQLSALVDAALLPAEFLEDPVTIGYQAVLRRVRCLQDLGELAVYREISLSDAGVLIRVGGTATR